MTLTGWRSPITLFALLAMGGCAGGSIAGAALDMIGMRKPVELPESQKPPRTIAIRLHAGPNLNTDASGHPLALVARIYKLRQNAAFERAAFDGFLNVHTERELLGNDLLEVKEVTLIPGQRYEISEKVSREASYIGVVALFRAPAAQRWRLDFAAGEAERSGITIGLHACAMSVGAGAASAAADSSAASKPLAAVRCG